MQSTIVTRTFVGAVALVGIAAASLTGTATASAAPNQHPTVEAAAFAPMTVNNLGLITVQAQAVQIWLQANGYYSGAIDGQLGTGSWMGFQTYLRNNGFGYTGAIDGIVGKGTIAALQHKLQAAGFYAGTFDGIAGPETRLAFAKFANSIAV